jgi:hypothetical protein
MKVTIENYTVETKLLKVQQDDNDIHVIVKNNTGTNIRFAQKSVIGGLNIIVDAIERLKQKENLTCF